MSFRLGIGSPADFVEHAAGYFQGDGVALDLDFDVFRKLQIFDEQFW